MEILEKNHNYDCVFVNGDSYSTGNLTYGDYLAEYFRVPVKQFAQAGSSNDRILRTTIEYLHEIRKQYKNPLVIIGWSFVRRIEIWYYENKKRVLRLIKDNPQSRFITTDWLLPEELTLEQKAMVPIDLHIHKKLTDFYTQLYLFGNLMDNMNLDYFCFSGADNTDCPTHCFPYIDSLYQIKWVQQNKAMFRLHDFCVANWAFKNDSECKSTGHLSEQGHRKFAKFILKELQKHE